MGAKKKLFKKMNRILDRIERLIEVPSDKVDWGCSAFRWHRGRLQGVPDPHFCELDDLLGMERQKAEVLRNTENFVQGGPANNVLLWGARGTGKSSLVKAVFHLFEGRGLRLIEIETADLKQLPELTAILCQRTERFVLYCDDLSFDADDASYKTLKALLEGSIVAPPDNVLVYATSNRRHLIPEYHSENQETHYVGDEVHPGESIEEKVSLSERFGLWLSFYPFDQDQYLAICDHWLDRLSNNPVRGAGFEQEAIQWAAQRGSRSGRVARQFAIDWLGH